MEQEGEYDNEVFNQLASTKMIFSASQKVKVG